MFNKYTVTSLTALLGQDILKTKNEENLEKEIMQLENLKVLIKVFKMIYDFLGEKNSGRIQLEKMKKERENGQRMIGISLFLWEAKAKIFTDKAQAKIAEWAKSEKEAQKGIEN